MEDNISSLEREERQDHVARAISEFIIKNRTTEMRLLINVVSLCQYYFLSIPELIELDKAKEFYIKFPSEMQRLIVQLDDLLDHSYESWGDD